MGLLSRVALAGVGAAGLGGAGFGLQSMIGSNIIDAMKRKQELTTQVRSQNPGMSDSQIQQIVEHTFAAENRKAMGWQ